MVTPSQVFVAGAANSTLGTAVSNLNTALASAVTTAQGVTGVIKDKITTTPAQLIYNGAAYVASASVIYQVVS